MEIWKTIKGVYPKAEVSHLGNVRQKRHIKGMEVWTPCKMRIKTGGYVYVRLKNKFKKVDERRLHIEVAKAFLPNLDNLSDVNHKDENKLNNELSNLEWCSHSANVKHSIKSMKEGQAKARFVKKQTMIVRSDGAKFNTLAEAAKRSNISRITIQNCLKGDIKRAGGYGWKRKSRDEISGMKQIKIEFD